MTTENRGQTIDRGRQLRSVAPPSGRNRPFDEKFILNHYSKPQTVEDRLVSVTEHQYQTDVES